MLGQGSPLCAQEDLSSVVCTPFSHSVLSDQCGSLLGCEWELCTEVLGGHPSTHSLVLCPLQSGSNDSSIARCLVGGQSMEPGAASWVESQLRHAGCCLLGKLLNSAPRCLGAHTA